MKMTRKELIEIIETIRFEDDDSYVWDAAAKAMGDAVASRLTDMNRLALLRLYCTPRVVPDDRATLKSAPCITRPPPSDPMQSEEAVDIADEVELSVPEDATMYGKDST